MSRLGQLRRERRDAALTVLRLHVVDLSTRTEAEQQAWDAAAQQLDRLDEQIRLSRRRLWTIGTLLLLVAGVLVTLLMLASHGRSA